MITGLAAVYLHQNEDIEHHQGSYLSIALPARIGNVT
jgi:hypothetical protein